MIKNPNDENKKYQQVVSLDEEVLNIERKIKINMKAIELAKKLLLHPTKDVHIHFNIRDNKTDEVELYESDDIQVGCMGLNDIIIRTEILVK